MYQKQFKYSLRFLLRNKSYTAFNIVGLALGLATAFIIFLWIQNEVSFDRFHENGKRIYKVFRFEHVKNGNDYVSSTQSSLLAEALLSDIPEIEAVARIPWSDKVLIQSKNKNLFQEGLYTDSTFFEMFSFPLLEGDPSLVLDDPNSLVISENGQNLFP